MVAYSYVDIEFEPYQGPHTQSTGVFVKEGKLEPIIGELGKTWWPQNSPRQPYFEAQVRRIADYLGSYCVPVYVRWSGGEKNQLDKGCIGHSFVGEASFIESIARNSRGEITHVILRDQNA